MKKRIQFFSLAAALLMLSALPACKNGDSGAASSRSAASGAGGTSESSAAGSEEISSGETGSSAETPSGTASAGSAAGSKSSSKAGGKVTPEGFYDSIKGTTLSIGFSEEPGAVDKALIEAFKKKYDCSVKYQIIPFSEWKSIFVQSVASGKPLDCHGIFDQDFVGMAAKNLFQPVDGFIEMNDPIWNRDVMEMFRWKGKNYGLYTSLESYDAGYIYFNKTLFEDEGIPDPYTLYKQGRWDFAALQKTAKDMTVKRADGKISRYGFFTWWYDAFILSNGNRQVNVKADGTVDITLNRPEVYEAMDLIRNMHCVDKSYDYTVAWAELFMAGKLAMVFERPWNVAGYYKLYDKKNFPDELGMAPPPKGPSSGGTYYAPALIQCTVIPYKAANPKAGAAWTLFLAEENKAKAADPKMIAERRKWLSDEHKAIADDFAKKSKKLNSFANGFGSWYTARWDLWAGVLRDNLPPATIVPQHIGMLRSEIEKTLSGGISIGD